MRRAGGRFAGRRRQVSGRRGGRSSTARSDRERVGSSGGSVGSRPARPPDQALIAAALLGDAHPLAQALGRRRLAVEQLGAVALVLTCGVGGALAGAPEAVPLLLAAGTVELALGTRAAILALDARQRAIDLVIAGREDAFLRCVQREAGRLRDPRTRARLGRSLAAVVQTARLGPRVTRPHTVIAPLSAAVAAPQLIEIAAQLLADPVPVCAVAAVERLLCDAGSPLYGHDHERLRQELHRIHYLLRDAPSGPARATPSA